MTRPPGDCLGASCMTTNQSYCSPQKVQQVVGQIKKASLAIFQQVVEKCGGVLGAEPLGEGVAENLP